MPWPDYGFEFWTEERAELLNYYRILKVRRLKYFSYLFIIIGIYRKLKDTLCFSSESWKITCALVLYHRLTLVLICNMYIEAWVYSTVIQFGYECCLALLSLLTSVTVVLIYRDILIFVHFLLKGACFPGHKSTSSYTYFDYSKS